MPYKPKRPCHHPGCPLLTDGYYCDKHQKLSNKTYNKYERDNFSKTFYNSKEWVEVRKKKIQLNPFCEECIKNGTIVKASIIDHIIPIKQGGAKFDLKNLQSLCWSCHSRKSIKEGSRFGKRV